MVFTFCAAAVAAAIGLGVAALGRVLGLLVVCGCGAVGATEGAKIGLGNPRCTDMGDHGATGVLPGVPVELDVPLEPLPDVVPELLDVLLEPLPDVLPELPEVLLELLPDVPPELPDPPVRAGVEREVVGAALAVVCCSCWRGS